jgi:bacterioferritin (cytochrome b1)
MDIFAIKNLPSAKEQPIFRSIQFKNIRPTVIGSYSLESQRNAGDIDIDVYIEGRIEYDFVVKEMKKIIKNIDDNDDTYFIEFKVQYNDPNKKIKFMADQVDDIQIPKENFNKIEYLKLDLVIFLVDSFKELSVNYWLNPTMHDVEKSIKDDIKEQVKEGNYYKAVKWSFSLAKFLNDKPKGIMISEFLNNYTGDEYKTLKNLKAIKLLLENYDDPLIRRRVRVNLINNEIIPKVSVIYRMIPKLEKKVNKEARKYFYDVLNKKYI